MENKGSLKSLRVEKKYIPRDTIEKNQARKFLLHNGFVESSSYNVYSIYFDFPGYKCAMDHIEGNFQRSKFRLRFYLNSSGQLINGISWEEKIREGEVGFKNRVRLSDFEHHLRTNLTSEQELRGFSKVLIDSTENVRNSNFSLANLMPICLIGYYRRRFESDSCDANIDDRFSISFLRHNIFNHLNNYDGAVVELKIPYGQPSLNGKNIENNMPLTRTRFSKYLFSLNKMGILGDY